MAASQTIRTLKLALLADVSKFGPELKKGTSEFEKFSTSISKASVPATAALGALVGIAASSIQAASDLSQTFGAVEQVFGARAAQTLDKFAREAATSLGQSRQEALGAAQTFGVLGRAAGLEGDQLADFAIKLSTLASDLAAFGNTTPQEAIEALGSALRGEFNPIERFGVVLNAAAVQTIALREGLAETAGEITAADQIYARFLGIVEQTAIQQGQFARESESLGAQAAIAKAQIENFRVEVGDQLLPVVAKLLPQIQDLVTTFASQDPQDLIDFGSGLAQVAIGIVALNTALKVFATLKATWLLLTGSAAGAAFGLAALGLVAVNTPAVKRAADARADELGSTRDILNQYGTNDSLGLNLATRPVPAIPRTGNLNARTIINVTGFVGNELELARAIERQLEAGRRAGALAR